MINYYTMIETIRKRYKAIRKRWKPLENHWTIKSLENYRHLLENRAKSLKFSVNATLNKRLYLIPSIYREKKRKVLRIGILKWENQEKLL